MTKFIVEHTTYARGGKETDETPFENEAWAKEFALQCLQRYGGRVWINNEEYQRSQLEKEVKHGE